MGLFTASGNETFKPPPKASTECGQKSCHHCPVIFAVERVSREGTDCRYPPFGSSGEVPENKRLDEDVPEDHEDQSSEDCSNDVCQDFEG